MNKHIDLLHDTVIRHGNLDLSAGTNIWGDVFISIEDAGSVNFRPTISQSISPTAFGGNRLEIRMHGKSNWEFSAITEALQKIIKMLEVADANRVVALSQWVEENTEKL